MRTFNFLFTKDSVNINHAKIFKNINSLLTGLPKDITDEKCLLFSTEIESSFSINKGFKD